MPTDIDIAQNATLRPILDVADEIGLSAGDLRPYGHTIAKITPEALQDRPEKGKVVLVTGMTPTPAGEGKSTVAVGLAQALRRLEKTADAILEMGVQYLGVSHCTGFKAAAYLADIFGDRFFHNNAGTRLTLPFKNT